MQLIQHRDLGMSLWQVLVLGPLSVSFKMTELPPCLRGLGAVAERRGNGGGGGGRAELCCRRIELKLSRPEKGCGAWPFSLSG